MTQHASRDKANAQNRSPAKPPDRPEAVPRQAVRDSTPETPPNRHEQRVNRALECLDQALQAADPFDASLGATTGSMMLVIAQLDQAIQNHLAAGELSLERFQKVGGAMEIELKFARQVDRLLHLMQHESQKSKKPPKPAKSRATQQGGGIPEGEEIAP